MPDAIVCRHGCVAALKNMSTRYFHRQCNCTPKTLSSSRLQIQATWSECLPIDKPSQCFAHWKHMLTWMALDVRRAFRKGTGFEINYGSFYGLILGPSLVPKMEPNSVRIYNKTLEIGNQKWFQKWNHFWFQFWAPYVAQITNQIEPKRAPELDPSSVLFFNSR